MDDQSAKRNATPRPEPLIISELRLNTIAYGWLFVAEVLTRKTSSGKPYLDLKLRDPRGNEIIGRYFDPPDVETQLPQEGKVLELEGLVEKFLNQTYIRVSYARVDESVPIDLFQVGTRHTISQLQDTFRQFINKVYAPGLHALLVRCFTPETLARFYRWPAAVRHHGAVRSGLLEHTVNVTLVADRLTQIYTCNQNLVLAGALLHDIGKLEELEEQVGAGFTVAGRMFGHVVLGALYVQAHARQVAELDEATREDLLHIILAHHGTKEFGSPVCPVTIEALLVHQADTAEAKLTGFLDHCERTATPDGWSSYSQAFGGQLRVP
jgi:3'-5' exoribonuclease